MDKYLEDFPNVITLFLHGRRGSGVQGMQINLHWLRRQNRSIISKFCRS